MAGGAALFIFLFAEIFSAPGRIQGVSGHAPELGHDPNLPAIWLR